MGSSSAGLSWGGDVKVHLLWDASQEERDELQRSLAQGITFTDGGQSAPTETQILVAGRPDRKILETCTELQAIVIPFAGVPENTLALVKQFPQVRLHNLHYNAAQTAEMALSLMFAAARQIVPHDQKLRKGDWRSRYEAPNGLLLSGKTALILGFGSIGQRVGRVCHALGMRVLATRRHIENPLSLDFPAEIHANSELASLLPAAHVVVICLPLTTETHNLIDANALALLPKGAIIVNIGRGPIVDEYALYEALKSGHLGGAGLDVWYNYPTSTENRAQTMPSNAPLHEIDSLVLSPHRAGGVSEREDRRMAYLAELLNAFLAGNTELHRVNPNLGY